jgi:hypothetical protein
MDIGQFRLKPGQGTVRDWLVQSPLFLKKDQLLLVDWAHQLVEPENLQQQLLDITCLCTFLLLFEISRQFMLTSHRLFLCQLRSQIQFKHH